MKNSVILKWIKKFRFRFAFVVLLCCAMSIQLTAQVKNVVLVHGAFADGSGWQAVHSLLTKKGYKVSVVANPNTGLAEDVNAVKIVLAQQDGPVILVGHSYGGAIITEAGNDAKVAGLVFISAFVPDAGESLLKLVQAGPPDPNSGLLPPKDGYIWFDKAKFHKGFCADLSKEQAAFMADSQVPIAAAVFGSTISVAAWKTKPSWYLVATEDKVIAPDAAKFMAKRAGAKITEIKSSHVSYISHPKEVAQLIETAAKDSTIN